MIEPRSFTFFAGVRDLSDAGAHLFDEFIEIARRMAAAYAPARTLRLTLPAIALDTSEDFDVDVALRSRWYERAQDAGFRWVNLPLRLTTNLPIDPERAQIISDLLSRRGGLFSSIHVSDPRLIDVASSLYAKICRSLSARDHRGFANFRLGIGFNIGEWTPFFPFSRGERTGVAVALEPLALVGGLWGEGRTFAEIQAQLTDELKEAERAFKTCLEGSRVEYGGADWSLAPLPNGRESVAALVETISGSPIGSGGTVATISSLTQCLKTPIAHGVTPAGFNGVMLSVLEDDVLANRFRHQTVTVNDLLLYSTVCGCGLDMIPISGDTPEVSIKEYMADIGALAFRLNKPLGGRLLPIRQLRAGQATTFSHDFVCNSAVVRL